MRTSVTILYALVGLVGFLAHRSADKRSWRAMALLLLVSTLGVVIYLNLKAGPSFGEGLLPVGAPHEARERDYFFFWAFICWGGWAGFGAINLSRRLKPPVGILAMVLPFAPAVLNWTAVDRRTDDAEARARIGEADMLAKVPPSGILLALGDNDTYPLWYLQQVEGTRKDVTIVPNGTDRSSRGATSCSIRRPLRTGMAATARSLSLCGVPTIRIGRLFARRSFRQIQRLARRGKTGQMPGLTVR
jgi:hypothetical protein